MTKKPKIRVKSPIAELDGDEMTRVLWAMIKEQLLFPFLEVDLDYYDLHVKHRDDTDDQVTIDAAKAVERYGVGVKCATITPNFARVEEYDLKQAWKRASLEAHPDRGGSHERQSQVNADHALLAKWFDKETPL